MFNLSLTSDGSHSLYSEKFEAYYHSTHGAIQETQVVFIEAGLTEKLNKVNDSISILELGFGTGLNAFMTFLEALHCGKNINYTTYELFPVGYEIASTLNYVEKLSAEKYYNVFREMHESLNESHLLEDKHNDGGLEESK